MRGKMVAPRETDRRRPLANDQPPHLFHHALPGGPPFRVGWSQLPSDGRALINSRLLLRRAHAGLDPGQSVRSGGARLAEFALLSILVRDGMRVSLPELTDVLFARWFWGGQEKSAVA